MECKHPARIIWSSLVVAWFFDFLFWNKTHGVSFFLFVLLYLIALLLLAWGEGRRPAWRGLILLLPALFFSAMTFVHEEPLTVFVDAILALFSLGVFTVGFQGGSWMRFSLTDYLMAALRLTRSVIVLPGAAWLTRRRLARQVVSSAETEGTQESAGRQQAAAVLRGVFLAVPVVGILAALLASADPVFYNGLRDFFGLFHLDQWGSYLFRTIYIVILAYLIAGAIFHALSLSREEKLLGLEQPWLKPFLGWTETLILLGSVDLLFAAFVGIQFRYFFGGQANIQVTGFTYAEYARRGFFELVMVAILSLLLYLGLSSAARRSTPNQVRVFQGLVGALVGLVIVILVSAFQRLLLYENAYGFSRLRTYTHVVIPWLGVLLVAAAILEIRRAPRIFALAAVLVGLGFGLSLNLLNVDGFIARQNAARAAQGSELDISYLVSLSDDSVPALVGLMSDAALPAAVRDQAGAALACRAVVRSKDAQPTPWQSFHLARSQAQTLLTANQKALAAYPTTLSNGVWTVKIGDQAKDCESYYIN